jgi:hypothetical protein
MIVSMWSPRLSNEEKDELIKKIDKIEEKLNKIERDSRIGLEDQLFFGLVVSLAFFLVALPFTELQSFFQTVFQFNETTALNISLGIRNIFIVSLLLSVFSRYYGAIKPHKGSRLISLLCLLFALDVFLANFVPALTYNLSVEIKAIAFPYSYIALFFYLLAYGQIS